MAVAAQRLEPVERVGILVRVLMQRRDVIAFEPTSPAASHAPPAVPLKDLQPRELPATLIEHSVMLTSRTAATHPTEPP